MNQRTYAQILINRIQSLCNQRGITINKLANMSGITTSTIDSLMNGKVFNPRIQTLHKIAIAFGMTPEEFLDFKEFSEFSFEDETDENE